MGKAKRDDSGKSPVVSGCFNYFPRALLAVGEVSQFGAIKYNVSLEEKNWLGLSEDRLINSLGRHILKLKIDGDIDPDSGLMHKAHIAWNALAVLEKELTTSDLPSNKECVESYLAVQKLRGDYQ